MMIWPQGARHVLIVGGAGYIGTVLTQELLTRGYRVRCLDSLIYGHGRAIGCLMGHTGYHFMLGDLCDARTVAAALKDVTDVVILAGLVGEPICKKYPTEHVLTAGGIARLLHLVNGMRLDRVIFASTCSNYGELKDGEIATEDTPLRPLSPYAEAKVMAEAQILTNRYDYCPTVLRFATAFGLSPRMRFDLTVSGFTRALHAGDVLQVYDPDTWRPYCHVRDIAKAVAVTLEARTDQVRGEVFNVGSNANNHTKIEVARLALDTVRKGAIAAGGPTTSDPRNYRVSFDKIGQVLGWRARTTVEQGVEELLTALKNGCFDDYDQRIDFYRNRTIQKTCNIS